MKYTEYTNKKTSQSVRLLINNENLHLQRRENWNNSNKSSNNRHLIGLQDDFICRSVVFNERAMKIYNFSSHNYDDMKNSANVGWNLDIVVTFACKRNGNIKTNQSWISNSLFCGSQVETFCKKKKGRRTVQFTQTLWIHMFLACSLIFIVMFFMCWGYMGASHISKLYHILCKWMAKNIVFVSLLLWKNSLFYWFQVPSFKN